MKASVTGITHTDGIWWFDAPIPRRLHRCKVQTSAVVDSRRIERCACGAIRLGGKDGLWLDKNSRRT